MVPSTNTLTRRGLVANDDRARWVRERENTFFGDADLDGEFSSGDLTAVFRAGQYEDDVTMNSSWASGDWNGDGDVDSGDFIVASQDGGCEVGPRPAVNAVPEPPAS